MSTFFAQEDDDTVALVFKGLQDHGEADLTTTSSTLHSTIATVSDSVATVNEIVNLLDAELGSPIEGDTVDEEKEEEDNNAAVDTEESETVDRLPLPVTVAGQISESFALPSRDHLQRLTSQDEGGMKTRMEILELEMRARAIRAMLRAQESREKNESVAIKRIVKDED